MSEQDRPNLTLGQPPGTLRKMGSIPRSWLWVLLLLHVAALVCLTTLLLRPAAPGAAVAEPHAALNTKELKAIALELEEKSLDAQAARAWKAYLEAAPTATERAEILYRVGKLHMQAGQFGEAAAALVRSDFLASAEDDRELKARSDPSSSNVSDDWVCTARWAASCPDAWKQEHRRRRRGRSWLRWPVKS